VLERTQRILVAHRTESVLATGHELSVELSSKEADRNKRNLFVLQYEMTMLPCAAERN